MIVDHKIVGVDFNKVILASDPSLEMEILCREYPDPGVRPEKCRWSAFRKKEISRVRFEEVRDMIFLPEYRHRLKPVVGAFEALRLLIQAGHEVLVVTSRVDRSCQLAMEWFYEASGLESIPFIGVGMDPSTGRKKSKGGPLRENRVDIYIDNSPTKHKQIIAEMDEFLTFPMLFLFGYAEIAEGVLPSYVKPLLSWRHLPDILDAIAV